jgi:hypothetical protein
MLGREEAGEENQMVVRLGQTVKGVKAKLEARRQAQSKDSANTKQTIGKKNFDNKAGQDVVIKP